MWPSPCFSGSQLRRLNLLAPLTGNKEGSEELMVLGVRPTHTRLPINALYTTVDCTTLMVLFEGEDCEVIVDVVVKSDVPVLPTPCDLMLLFGSFSKSFPKTWLARLVSPIRMSHGCCPAQTTRVLLPLDLLTYWEFECKSKGPDGIPR